MNKKTSTAWPGIFISFFDNNSSTLLSVCTTNTFIYFTRKLETTACPLSVLGALEAATCFSGFNQHFDFWS